MSEQLPIEPTPEALLVTIYYLEEQFRDMLKQQSEDEGFDGDFEWHE